MKTIIEPDGTRESSFSDLPAIIREYESEYHYLFSLIYNLANDPENSEGYMYLLPNALRKVLETYLAFKQPGFSDLEGLGPLIEAHEKIDPMQVRALEALAQTESHAQSIGDTITFSQFTLEQIADAARAFLHLVEITDPMHSERMGKLCRKAA